MTKPQVFPLFVYGSLRRGFRSPAYEYISRYFTFAGDARVKGKLYDMGEYPAGVPTVEEQYIHGELYKIRDESEFSWAIGQLDDYEGVSVAFDEMLLYRREIAEVHIDNKITNAWIYWYIGDIKDKPVIESGDVLQYMEQKKQSLS